MRVESSASDLNFFSGMCSVVWCTGALYFLSDPKTRREDGTPRLGEGECLLLLTLRGGVGVDMMVVDRLGWTVHLQRA